MPSSENFDPDRIRSHSTTLYGIKATLRPNDGFAAVIGSDWETTRWYATASERDEALKTIGQRHKFSRVGDAPALDYAPIEQTVSNKN